MAIVFYVLSLLSIICCAIFLFVEAFRVKEVVDVPEEKAEEASYARSASVPDTQDEVSEAMQAKIRDKLKPMVCVCVIV